MDRRGRWRWWWWWRELVVGGLWWQWLGGNSGWAGVVVVGGR